MYIEVFIYTFEDFYRNKVISNSSFNSSYKKCKNCSPTQTENVPTSDSEILLVKFIKTKNV